MKTTQMKERMEKKHSELVTDVIKAVGFIESIGEVVVEHGTEFAHILFNYVDDELAVIVEGEKSVRFKRSVLQEVVGGTGEVREVRELIDGAVEGICREHKVDILTGIFDKDFFIEALYNSIGDELYKLKVDSIKDDLIRNFDKTFESRVEDNYKERMADLIIEKYVDYDVFDIGYLDNIYSTPTEIKKAVDNYASSNDMKKAEFDSWRSVSSLKNKVLSGKLIENIFYDYFDVTIVNLKELKRKLELKRKGNDNE